VECVETGLHRLLTKFLALLMSCQGWALLEITAIWHSTLQHSATD
jgi:hypothetical protein